MSSPKRKLQKVHKFYSRNIFDIFVKTICIFKTQISMTRWLKSSGDNENAEVAIASTSNSDNDVNLNESNSEENVNLNEHCKFICLI